MSVSVARQAEFDRVRRAICAVADPEPFYFVPHRVGREHYFFNQHDGQFYAASMPELRGWLRRVSNGVCGSDLMKLDQILRGIASVHQTGAYRTMGAAGRP